MALLSGELDLIHLQREDDHIIWEREMNESYSTKGAFLSFVENYLEDGLTIYKLENYLEDIIEGITFFNLPASNFARTL